MVLTITITSGSDLTSNKFTVTGTDMFGNSITEVITGGNNETVYGKKVFKLINSIVPSAIEAWKRIYRHSIYRTIFNIS